MPRALIAAGAALALSAAPAQAGFRDNDCPVQGKVRVCEGMVESFDATQLDATLTLPKKVEKGKRLPLVVFLHGFLSDKNEYIATTKRTKNYKTVELNNVWFATRGYAVLNYSARGHGGSGGEIGLASKHVDVRDAQHLSGLLVDDKTVNRRKVAAIGGSYGGGQTWLLVTVRGKGAKQYGSWLSPKGRLVELAAAVPQFTWTDLLESLVPSGRADSTDLLGIGKITLLNGFIATAMGKLTEEAMRWLVRLNAGEPYEGDATVEEAKLALTRDRSAAWQAGFFKRLARGPKKQRAIPILAAQGWTDPIFAAGEAVRMYDLLRKARKGYPIQLYFGDFEHLTSQIKIPDMRYYHRLATTLLDHYLKKAKRKPTFDVRSAPTLCDPKAFGPVLRAGDWNKLHPDRLKFEQTGTRMTGSPVTDPRAAALDHVAVSLSGTRGCTVMDGGETAGVATRSWDVKEDFTLIGLPKLRIYYTSIGQDVQLNSRLWDEAPDGSWTLVTRGVYRVGMPGNGNQRATYKLFGNHWRFQKGHKLVLEVTGDDSTFFRRDNFPSTTNIDRVVLTLPGEGG